MYMKTNDKLKFRVTKMNKLSFNGALNTS